jgi:nicotinate-nucleotide pyrophosphorylase
VILQVLKNWRDRLQKSLRYTSVEIEYQQIRRCIEIGLDCVKLDRWKRPTISQVIKMLHGTECADFSGRKEVMSLTNEVRSYFSFCTQINH